MTANLDTDHAVANEREAIAVWLESVTIDHAVWANTLDRGVIAMAYDGTPQGLIDAIRDGAHHANTPPNAQERG